MGFTTIDFDQWERKEYFRFFRDTCIYVTVQTDITALLAVLERRGKKLYPALLYCAARVANADADFRYGFDEAHQVGIWDCLHPAYTVPRSDCELFAIKCTRFTDDFEAFHAAYLIDIKQAADCGRLFADENPVENAINMTAAPGVHFTALSFCSEPKPDLTPFIMFGKYAREGERVMLPVCGEFAHAVNDGLHVGRFFDRFQAEADRLAALLGAEAGE